MREINASSTSVRSLPSATVFSQRLLRNACPLREVPVIEMLPSRPSLGGGMQEGMETLRAPRNARHRRTGTAAQCIWIKQSRLRAAHRGGKTAARRVQCFASLSRNHLSSTPSCLSLFIVHIFPVRLFIERTLSDILNIGNTIEAMLSR